MLTWITSAGLLSNISRGNSYEFNLECQNAIDFEILSGNLPDNLQLSLPTDAIYAYPTIYGNVNVSARSELYSFTIRANDANGNISDRGFSLNVLDDEPGYIFPNSNLGYFYDGNYMQLSISPDPFIPEFYGKMKVRSGQLPANVSLCRFTGNIKGYINPNVLYDTPPIYENIEEGSPNLPGSMSSKQYNFTVGYDSNISKEYSLIVVSNNSNVSNRFSDYEVPLGNINGITTTFTINNTPMPISSLEVYYNYTSLTGNSDFVFSSSNNAIMLDFAPEQGASLYAFYIF